jgi:hypothetical protein
MMGLKDFVRCVTSILLRYLGIHKETLRKKKPAGTAHIRGGKGEGESNRKHDLTIKGFRPIC